MMPQLMDKLSSVAACLCLYIMGCRHIQPVVGAKCPLKIEDNLWPLQWYLNKTTNMYDLNILEAWENCANGSGITVGVLDTGIHDHVDLRIDRSIGFNQIGKIEHEHGTNVAGIIGAIKNTDFITGVAFEAEIADIRITSESVFETLKPTALSHGLDIIDIYSCSFTNKHAGDNIYPLLYEQEQELLNGTTQGRQNLGSVYVFSSGNGHVEPLPYNCGYDRLVANRYVILVAGIQHDLSKVPNGEACSAMMVATFTATRGDKNFTIVTLNGTKTSTSFGENSAAVPMVSGAIALALSANPNLSYRDVMHLLTLTSRTDLPEFRKDIFMKNAANFRVSSYFGFGLLDIGKLVSRSKNWTNVPPVTECVSALGQTSVLSSSGQTLSLSNCNITYTEHIDVIIYVEYEFAIQLKWFLISPQGTRTTILPGIVTLGTLKNITVTTVQMWGENPNGNWTIQPIDSYGEIDDGRLNVKLRAYGFSCFEFPCEQLVRSVDASEVQISTPIGSTSAATNSHLNILTSFVMTISLFSIVVYSSITV